MLIVSNLSSFFEGRVVARSIKAEDLREGNVVWVNGYQATVLSVEQIGGGYDVCFKIFQSTPLVDFHVFIWLNKDTEIKLIQ